MRFFTYSIIVGFITLFAFSCSEDTLKLYHEKEPEPPVVVPEYYWLVETVDYSDQNPGFSKRNDQVFTYTDDDLMRTIKGAGPADSTIFIDRMGKNISYSRKRGSNYDSLLIKLNANNQVEYARHVIYTERVASGITTKTKIQDDSTRFEYSADGYMTKLEHYEVSGRNAAPSYYETYKIEDGNLTEILTSKKYRFTYTYDDKKHADPAEYCYEMPRNTFNMSTSCWFMGNIPFLSEFMGKRSKNNVVKTVIMDERTSTPVKYAEINYDYTFDKNGLVSEMKMSGMTNTNENFDNLFISFSYLEKEKK